MLESRLHPSSREAPSPPPQPQEKTSRQRETAERYFGFMAALTGAGGVVLEQPAAHSFSHLFPAVIRRERLDRIEALMRGTPLTLARAMDAYGPYANAAMAKTGSAFRPAIAMAFQEGHAMDAGIAAVIAFTPGEHLQIDPPSQEGPHRTVHGMAVAAQGQVPLEAVRFVAVRVPLHLFPASELTDTERPWVQDPAEDDRKHVFRYVVFPTKGATEKKKDA